MVYLLPSSLCSRVKILCPILLSGLITQTKCQRLIFIIEASEPCGKVTLLSISESCSCCLQPHTAETRRLLGVLLDPRPRFCINPITSYSEFSLFLCLPLMFVQYAELSCCGFVTFAALAASQIPAMMGLHNVCLK